MRSMMRAALMAVALCTVVAPASVLAQTKAAAATVIPIAKVPKNVLAAFKKAYPSAKITQVDQSGSGKTAVFHFTMTGARLAEVKVNGAGKIIKK